MLLKVTLGVFLFAQASRCLSPCFPPPLMRLVISRDKRTRCSRSCVVGKCGFSGTFPYLLLLCSTHINLPVLILECSSLWVCDYFIVVRTLPDHFARVQLRYVWVANLPSSHIYADSVSTQNIFCAQNCHPLICYCRAPSIADLSAAMRWGPQKATEPTTNVDRSEPEEFSKDILW